MALCHFCLRNYRSTNMEGEGGNFSRLFAMALLPRAASLNSRLLCGGVVNYSLLPARIAFLFAGLSPPK